MKKILLILIILLFGVPPFAQAQVYKTPNTVIINTSDAIVFHATDCTGMTAVEGVLCYEEDSNRVFACEPSAGSCDTAGEWFQVAYCNSIGCTYTGKVTFTTLKLTPQASPPGGPASGDIYMDSTPTPDELCVYDGAAWQGISSGTDANCA